MRGQGARHSRQPASDLAWAGLNVHVNELSEPSHRPKLAKIAKARDLPERPKGAVLKPFVSGAARVGRKSQKGLLYRAGSWV